MGFVRSSSAYFEGIPESEFLRLMLEERLLFGRRDSWVTLAALDEAPGEVLARVSDEDAGVDYRLVRLRGAAASLALRERSLSVYVAAADPARCEATLEQLRAALAEAGEGGDDVPVRFWWWRGHSSTDIARMLPAQRWQDVAGNYAPATATALTRLASWREGPPPGGRLLLWHGPAGTGKTTALRTLAREWSPWAFFEFVTDPEFFLQNPSYLMGTIGARASATRRGWKVIVLEDAGEYLAPDAKTIAGQALSRLLNVCDGALGQATRTLILVTTNEPATHLHPALTRPGRCLSEVAFDALERREVERWCVAHDVPVLDRDQATIAELFARAEGRPLARGERGVGFAAA